MRAYVCARVRVRVRVRVWACMCVYVCVYLCVCAHMCISACICIHDTYRVILPHLAGTQSQRRSPQLLCWTKQMSQHMD